MQKNWFRNSEGEARFLFPRWMRRLLFCIGLFVLYSQLVAVGLTGVHRYPPLDPEWIGSAHLALLDPCTLDLLQPPAGMRIGENWRSVGWDLEFSPFLYLAWAFAAPVIGAAALLFAGIAGTGWRSRCLLFAGSCLGVLAAFAIKLHEWIRETIDWAWIAPEGMLSYIPPAVYGHLQLIGSFLLPILMHLGIVVFVISSGRWSFFRYSILRGNAPEPIAPRQSVRAHDVATIEGDTCFLFSRRIRRLLFYVGLFTLYSQLASAGLTGVYRYSPWEKTWMDGGHPPVFDYCTLTVIQPPEGIGTSADWLAVRRDVGGSPFWYAAWAVVPPLLGSATLLMASSAAGGWLPRCLLLLGSILGIAAAILVKMHEWAHGSVGWAFMSGIITDRTLPHAPHPIYGYVELIGSLFLPIIAYAAIVVFVVVSALWGLARWSIGLAGGRQHPNGRSAHSGDRDHHGGR